MSVGERWPTIGSYAVGCRRCVTIVVRMHVDGRWSTRRLDSQAAMPYGAVVTKAMRVL
jgi:hypothetical protein